MRNGYLRFFNRHDEETKIGIDRIQIEQDSARSFHDFKYYSGIDYNRAGSALLEIVTYPEITHPADGKIVIRELQETLKLLNISLANMEEGQMRCDVNISLTHKTDPLIKGSRVEIKNVQGVRFVEKAIEAELIRQAKLLDSGHEVAQQTRRYDVKNDKTVLLREKEQDLDYRFMYDPDLPSYFVSPELIKSVENDLDLIPFDIK
jgi:aspartyl-tRNA(Asn)/glutamyl-tRNA(Gln) amidotransferase subunit B